MYIFFVFIKIKDEEDANNGLLCVKYKILQKQCTYNYLDLLFFLCVSYQFHAKYVHNNIIALKHIYRDEPGKVMLLAVSSLYHNNSF